ncbi:substrate-binding domain-containing protein [Thermogladius calderae]|uniref:substrate-binding domain-containing protein n=1 Tax=Thermogladius calderae TaxID=1200300 RepID=UPI00064E89DA|nr:substrate-binding domain-containing protein [Thermogladius calderae]
MSKTVIAVALLATFLAGFAGGYLFNFTSKPTGAQAQTIRITVSTTTSLYQTHLLDDLLADFKNTTGLSAEFSVLAKGSGEALRLLSDGSACLGFTHAPSLELKYILNGSIVRLSIFAYNEFVIVGPRDDPAGVSNATSAVDAFKKIYDAGEKGLAKFVSRGDNSGTHVRELQLWKLAGLDPSKKTWYLVSGQGMAQTLLMADNTGAYTLTDVGTLQSLVSQGKISNLVVLLRDPKLLINVYSFYVSSSQSCRSKDVSNLALLLAEYLNTRGQQLIASKYKDLFSPALQNLTTIESAWLELSKLA